MLNFLNLKNMQNENSVIETNQNLTITPESQTSVIDSATAHKALELLDKVDNATDGVKLEADYFEFKVEGEKSRGVFLGYQDVQFKTQDFDPKNPTYTPGTAVKWMTKEGGKAKAKICASVALVNTMKKNNVPVGSAIEIAYTGKDGNVKLFDVTILGIK